MYSNRGFDLKQFYVKRNKSRTKDEDRKFDISYTFISGRKCPTHIWAMATSTAQPFRVLGYLKSNKITNLPVAWLPGPGSRFG